MGFVEDQKVNKNYYYCTKMVRFPLNTVIKAIYDFYKSQDASSLEFNDIYDFLREKFQVKSFNRQNLYNLLNSYGQIPFSIVNDLYLANNISGDENKIYNLEILKNVFVTNSKALKDIISSLGIDFLITIAEKGLIPLIDHVNDILRYFNPDTQILELNNRCKYKLFDKNNAKIFIELLKTCSDEEWIELLSDENQIKEFISMFIEEKEIEQKKLTLKKSIIFLVEQINDDNKEAIIRYLLPVSISSILEEQKIFKVSDLNSISNKTVIACYDYRDIILNTLKKLNRSIPEYLNEKFKYLLQMVNKDYRPNSLWENYVSILERRADDLTLEKAGENIGVTRQRVKQLEKKYLLSFSNFYNSQNGSLSNLIRAYCENPLFIQDQDIEHLFCFNPKIFKYFLKNAEIDDVLFIEELDKFYFVDDYDWYKELLMYGENMPNQLDSIKLENYINKAHKMLQANDVNLSLDDCRAILIQDYKLIGTLYSKTSLSLAERFKNILKQFYPNPVNIYDESFILEFRKHYYDIYKDDKIKTDHAITSILARIGMLVGRGEYILNDREFMSKELAEKMYQYIIDSGRDIFLTNNLFSIFKDELLAEGINNKYFMQGALKQRAGDKLFFRRDYISTTKENTSIYGEIAKFIKDSNKIITYDELQSEFIGASWSVLMFAISQESILNYRAKYVHFDTLNLNDKDIEYLRNSVSDFVSDNQIHHVNDLLTYIRLTNKELISKMMIEDQFGLYSVLEYLFSDKYEFKRPFIANNGIKIENQVDRLKEFVNSEDELLIDSIIDFAYDNKLHLNSIVEFVDGLDNYIFKDKESIININKTNLNKYNTEIVENMIIKIMGSNEFIFADELNFYNIMPKEVAWTPWLLYSALNKYGTKLKAIPSNNIFKIKNNYYAKPIIIRKDIPVKNLNEYIRYLKNESNLNDTEFYKYLKSKGLA